MNNFTHLKQGAGEQQTINFIKQLRRKTPDMPNRITFIDTSPPSFYGQGLQSQKIKHCSADISIGNISNVEHLLRRRIGPQSNLAQASFETSLRSYSNDTKNLHRKRGWSQFSPNKNNQYQEEGINKLDFTQNSFRTDTTKMIQNSMISQQKQSIFYGPYQDLEEKNAGLFKGFEKDHQGQVNQGTLRWQFRLKRYTSTMKDNYKQQQNQQQRPSIVEKHLDFKSG